MYLSDQRISPLGFWPSENHIAHTLVGSFPLRDHLIISFTFGLQKCMSPTFMKIFGVMDAINNTFRCILNSSRIQVSHFKLTFKGCFLSLFVFCFHWYRQTLLSASEESGPLNFHQNAEGMGWVIFVRLFLPVNLHKDRQF